MIYHLSARLSSLLHYFVISKEIYSFLILGKSPNDNKLWMEAIKEEMKNVCVAFEVYDGDIKDLEKTHQKIKCQEYNWCAGTAMHSWNFYRLMDSSILRFLRTRLHKTRILEEILTEWWSYFCDSNFWIR